MAEIYTGGVLAAYAIEFVLCVLARAFVWDSLWLCYVNPWFRIFGEGFAGILICEYMNSVQNRINDYNKAEWAAVLTIVLFIILRNVVKLNILSAWAQIIPMGILVIVFRQEKGCIKLLRERKGAVVIAFMPQNKLLTGMASFFINNKIVFTERNDPAKSPGTKLSRFVRNVLYELADLCVFQTSQAKEYFSKRVQSHGCVIQNPINPDLPEPFVGKRKKVVIAAARLEAQKNLFMLIDAFAMFHEGHPDYHLEIYGKGPLKDALSQRITDRGISEAARLMGYSNDVYSRMCDCAMYVSSSDFEGISNSMLEAMGLGLPTICTDCPVGGARETIEDGVNGVLIPVGDVRALYNAMTRVADDSEFAHRISMKAIDIRQKLSAEVIANQWIKAIESL